ncbi:uncharacterized protein LOC126285182 [Schistocerca gregaria]|uniref:uncharacterized protein LOC126285182 n=1 Tax=Schistocerca gregaria TaxID=7010 RepID=UPI00211E1C3A|nr:uncharacterized protein LOC126285182 [Schistocerca gregaria]
MSLKSNSWLTARIKKSAGTLRNLGWHSMHNAALKPYLRCSKSEVPTNEKTMFLYPVPHSEVRKAINKLKNKMSCGCGGIPDKVIKHRANKIITELVDIINTSFKTGEFPSALKKSIIKPLYKKDYPYTIQNYRQLSQLSGFSELIERLLSFLNKCKVLTNAQNGFRKNRSTETAVGYSADDIQHDTPQNNIMLLLKCTQQESTCD